MAAVASAEGAPRPLLGLLEQAGAVFASRENRRIAVHYGSAAGELAVCVSAVGLVDRSDLSKLVIEAPASQLGHLTERLAGGMVAPGGALRASGAWWCGAAPDRIVVLCEPHLATRLRSRLRDHAVHYAALSVQDRSGDWAAIELLGHSAGKVLRALGAFGEAGDPRQVSPFTARTVAGHPVRWLLESDRCALLLVPTQSAGAVWQAIEQAGRPAGISCVGLEAASRYALLERTVRGTPLRAH
jgi:glycine cleavage system aminomethyltransferase T